MKTHASIGARILAGGRSRVVQLAEEIALYHHEQWDGQGYPQGVAGEVIPLSGRLVMVADVYDALTSDRVYRDAWPTEMVLAYIREYAGRRFDPRIAALCDRPDVRGMLLDSREREAAHAGMRNLISTRVSMAFQVTGTPSPIKSISGRRATKRRSAPSAGPLIRRDRA